MRLRLTIAVAATLGALAFTLGPSPALAAGAPRWQLRSLAQPTNFAPGDRDDTYRIVLTNIGDGPQSGELEISDSLPPGVNAKSIEFFAPELEIGGQYERSGEDCTLAPQLRCRWPGPLLPEQPLVMIVHVAVPLSAEGSLTNTVSVSGGSAPDASASSSNLINETPASFGVQDFRASLRNRDGSAFTQAGGHPYEFHAEIDLNTGRGKVSGVVPSADPRNLTVDLPPGLIGNPRAIPQCPLSAYQGPGCPEDTQVGTWAAIVSGGVLPANGIIYNLAPQPGVAGELGFKIYAGVSFVSQVGVRSGGDYGLRTTTLGIPESQARQIEFTIWGVPAAAEHDRYRAECIDDSDGVFRKTCPSPYSGERAFLSAQGYCTGNPFQLGIVLQSWQRPELGAPAAAELPAIDGCNQLAFDPTIQARPTTNRADSPSGLDVHLHIPLGGLEEPEGLTEANLKDTVVTLPRGLTLNPSAAGGLGACSEAQVGYLPGSVGPFEFTPDAARCPDSAKLGSVEVDTPLLANPLPGSVYLARQGENPFGSLLAIYLVVDDPLSGTIVKLVGQVSPDPQTGQLTTTFSESPQLPFEEFQLHFFGGGQGTLRTPFTCGSYATASLLTPWSAPESGPPVEPHDEFEITAGAGGGSSPCPNSPAQQENAPRFRAGTESPQAGKFSPFAFRLVREDGSQELSKIETTLPPGLVGKLAGLTECSDAQIAAAQSREHEGGGEEEKANPSCPAASEVGTVEVGAGAGPNPLYVTGHAYLAGPYKGSPLSLMIITPAVAGPFDLGDVVVRTALFVDPFTAQIKAVSDEIPHILQGIPLDVRSVTLKMNRPNFTLNPTNCNELGFTGSATSVLGAIAPLSQRFQVGGCVALPFKPKLSLRLKGSPRRAQFPALTATLTMPPGNANVAAAQVTLPHSSFLSQGHIAKTCGRPELASHTCPASSIYGHATAVTPLLEHPLEGPVYLATGFGYQLPALVADLNGQIEVLLKGKVDSGRGDGIRNTFEVVPDALVSKFTLHMFGGKKSLIENSEYLCGRHAKRKALARFTGQNGKVVEFEPVVANSCKHKHSKHSKGGHKHRPARALILLKSLRL
jgi:hypothetical protein